MQLTRIPVVLLILLARAWGGKILIPLPGDDESISSLVDDLVNVVTSCYGDRIDAVGIAGDIPDALLKTLSTRLLIPVAVMGDTYDFDNLEMRKRGHTFRKIPHPLRIFIIEASSWDHVMAIMTKTVRYSIWWNHRASFFFLDRSPGCVNAIYFLSAARLVNRVNAKVMCYHHEDGRIIMTYNPYANQAPAPWQRVENEDNFNLYRRDYRANEEICVNLDFEKTKNLWGHPIPTQTISNDSEDSRTKRLGPQLAKHGRILSIICRTLNLKPNVRTIERFDATAFTGYIAHFSSPLIINNHIVSTTYPHEQVTFVVISKFRDYAQRLNKIGLSIVYLVTLIFFKFFVSRTLMTTFRNLVGINCNTSSRIYLAGLLLFAITIQCVYQSDLTFALTKRSPLRNVETHEDLVSLGYKKIYVYDNQDSVIVDPEARKRFIITKSNEECFTLVMNDSSAACIWTSEGSREIGRRFGLHVSSEPFSLTNYGIPIDWNLPYNEEVNEVLAKCAEAGILDTWLVRCTISYLNDLQFGTFGDKVDVKSLDLREMKFAFLILGIGLACAAVAFILELVIKYQCIFARRYVVY